MRGFRGSRAARNLTSRFGHGQYGHSQDQPSNSQASQSLHQGRVLPDWLKTPETKAAELEVARIEVAEPIVRKLTLVVSNPAQKSQVEPVARKKKKPLSRIKAAVRPKAKAKPRAVKPSARRKAA